MKNSKNGYTLEYLAKVAEKQRKRKGYRGWFEVLNAGNVPHNIEMFNKMSGAATSGTPDSMTGNCSSTGVQSSGEVGAIMEQMNSTDIKNRLKNLELGEVLTLKGSGVPEYPYLRITRNSKHPNLYKLWNESPEGEMSNEINFSTLQNTLYVISQCDELTESYMNNNHDNTIELEYPEVTVEVVTRHGSPTGYFSQSFGNWLPDDDETKEIEVPFTYEADETEVLEVLGDLIKGEPEVADIDDDDEFYGYIEDHLDELVDRFQEELLDHFRDDATEAAQEQDWEDWLYEDYNESNPYIFKDLQEAANSDIELKDYWEDLPPVEEEHYEPIDTKLDFEGIDADDPVLDSNEYEWADFDPDKYSSDWELVNSKDVFDADGFIASYNWYQSADGSQHVFTYEEDPSAVDIAHADFVCEDRKEAADWFNSYKGFEDDDSALDEIPDIDVPAKVEDIDFDDNQEMKQSTLTEGRMKDLDIDVQDAGSKEALILKLEKDLAALDSEISFLEDAQPIEVDPDSVFGSREVINNAIESARKDRELVLSKLSLLRG